MRAEFQFMMATWRPLAVEISNEIHSVAKVGFSRSSDHYDKSRSGYPPALADRLMRHLGVIQDAKVLELGAGTGKWTENILRHSSQVTIVEPVQEMRASLEKRFPRILVEPAQAEALPFADASFDFVFVATAFHWFDARKAYSEISRVLRPGGGL